MHLTSPTRPGAGASTSGLPRALAAVLLTLLVAAGLPVPQALAAGTATVTGTVTAPDGQALPQAAAVTVRVTGLPETVTAVASNGSYSVTVPADTQFSIAAGPTETASLADSTFFGTRLAAGESLTHTLALRLPTVTGSVTDPSGAPVAGSYVVHRMSGTYEHTTSKKDGSWATAGPSGTYDVDAQPPAGSDLRPSTFYRLTAPLKGAVLRLQPAPNVTGTVSLPNGDPALGAHVRAETSSGQYLQDPGASSGVDPEGKFGLLLASGDYKVVASPPFEATDLVPTTALVTVPESATATVGIVLQRGNVLGTVLTPDGSAYTGNGHVEVRDATGQYLPGVSIRKGTFALKLQPNQQVVVTARPYGDASLVGSEPMTVTAPADGGAAATPALTLRTPNVKGTVRGLDGSPSANSPVQVVDKTGQHVDYTNTDSTGTYALRLPAGEYVLRAQPAWNASAEVVAGHQPVTVADSLLEQDLRLRRANVLGVVRDPNTATVANAPIQVTDANGAHVDAFTTSRSDGSYGLLLPDGTFTATARAPHGDTNAWVAGSVEVTASSTSQVTGADVFLQRPNLVGYVRTPDGAAVPGAPVSVTDAHGYYVHGAWAFTGSTGKFGLLLPAGDYVLHASPPPNGDSTLAGGSSTVTVGSTVVEKDIALRRPNVSGEVRKTDGTLLSNSHVEVFDKTRGTYLQGAHAGTGRYSLFLQPGDYRLTARPPYGSSGLVATSIEVTVTEGSSQLDRNIVLAAPNLTGTVTDRDGKPVANSLVDAVDSKGQYLPGAYSITGSDGTYALRLPAGTYAVTARPAWHDPAGHVASTVRDVVVSDPGSTTRDIRLGTPNVVGTVLTPDGQPHANGWIEVRDANGQYVQGVYAFTNAEGKFALALPVGQQHQLTARPSWNSTGLVPGSASVTAAEGTTTQVKITLRTPNVTGKVTTADGTLVSGSHVDVVAKATGEHVAGGWAYTGQQGTYSLILPAGEYWLTARPAWNSTSDAVATRVALTVVDGSPATRDVQLGTANVSGTVTGSDATSLPYLLVRALDAAGKEVAHAWTSSSGAFRLGLPAGSYSLAVEPPYDNPDGYVRTTTSTFEVAGSPVVQDVQLAKGNTTGVVTDADGRPVANAFVHVFESGAVEPRGDLGVATDTQGRFVVGLLSGSTWQLQAQPSYELSQTHNSSDKTPVAAGTKDVKLVLLKK